jgi:hypothetical protein
MTDIRFPFIVTKWTARSPISTERTSLRDPFLKTKTSAAVHEEMPSKNESDRAETRKDLMSPLFRRIKESQKPARV